MTNLRKAINNIPKDFKKRWVWIVLNIFFKACFNFAGIAALLAIILLLLSDQSQQQYIWLYTLVGIIILIIKNVAVVFLETRERKFSLSLYKYYSRALLKSYYSDGYLKIKGKGVYNLNYNINQVCFSFVICIISPLLRILGEATLISLIIIGLFIYSPIVTGALLLLFIPIFLLYYYIIRKKMSKYGQLENKAKSRQWGIVGDLLKGYPEIEINDAYFAMQDKFETELNNISKYRIKSTRLSLIPKSLVEVGMAGSLLILVLCYNDPSQLKTMLGIFGVCSFKILPGISNLINSWIMIKNNDYTLEVINEIDPENFTEKKEDIREVIEFKKDIEVKDLWFKYPEDDFYVIRGLNLNIKKGEILGIQGLSGSGKSTLFNILLGFYQASKGSISIDNKSLTLENKKSWQTQIGYVPQDVFIMNGTLAENIALGSAPEEIDIERVKTILDSVQLNSWYKNLEEGTLLSDMTLSGGQKQRIGIARALYKGAKVVFLDEATSALDNETEQEVMSVIDDITNKNKDLTLIIIAHRDSSLKICDRIINICTIESQE